jgi:hypothetical protein
MSIHVRPHVHGVPARRYAVKRQALPSGKPGSPSGQQAKGARQQLAYLEREREVLPLHAPCCRSMLLLLLRARPRACMHMRILM